MSKQPIEIRYGIALTYRCNASCPGCNRFLDKMPWPDSDLTLEDLLVGWDRVKETGIKVSKVRITGGEPLLHKQFVGCMRIIQQTWNKDYGGRTAVFSNGTQRFPDTEGWRYVVSGVGTSKRTLTPPMISPIDLGIPHTYGIGNGCHRRNGCGRLFDVHGFAGCIFAGAIGKALRRDPYKATPVIEDGEEICGHCVFSVGVGKAFKLFRGVENGDVEYPTPSYQRAIRDYKEKGPFVPKLFRERAE